MRQGQSIASFGKRSADHATEHTRSRRFHNLITWFLLRLTGLDEGLNLSPWASLANAAILKELCSGRSLSGPRGRGLGFNSYPSCLPVVPILRKPVFMSNNFFNLFSSWRRVPPLVVRGVAPFHVRNNALYSFVCITRNFTCDD